MNSSAIKAEGDKLISETSAIIKLIYSNDGTSKISDLSKVIPQMDKLILKYKPFFPESIQICADDQFFNIANKRIKVFIDNRKNSILSMYDKTFAYYHHFLDELTNQIVRTSMSLKTIKENSAIEVENRIAEMKRHFEYEFKELKERNKTQLSELSKKIEDNINGMDSRVENEELSLTQHYEKILQSKNESLTMTESAYEKAKTEADAAASTSQSEISAIISKNNEILKEHSKSVMSTLVVEEKKVKELQEKVDEITVEYDKIAPEIERRWEEKKNELMSKFKVKDEHYQLKKIENDILLTNARKQLEECNKAIDNIQLESQITLDNSKSDMEEKLQKVINNCQSQIDQEVKSKKEKFKEKIHELKESLKKVSEQSKTDEESMKERIQDKNELLQDRLKALKEDQLRFIENIVNEINQTKELIVKTKNEWDEQRKKIESDYETQFEEIQAKKATSYKYFEMKFEAIRKELHHMLRDNAKIFDRIAADNDDLLSLKIRHKEEEAQMSQKVQEEMKEKSNEKIRKKMEELRQKHSNERFKILEQIDSARKSELSLENLYNGALLESQREPERLFNSYTKKEDVEQIKENEPQKWKKEAFENIKALKEEEAEALKELCSTKDEFRQAVDHTMNLREKLNAASTFYTNEVKKTRDKNEEQLNQLREVIIIKQKEISDLEYQFDENEKELSRKARLVEKAEDKLADLRNKLLREKELIRQKIMNDYQPLIENEHDKSEKMARQIEELKSELLAAIEFKKHELELLEASNAEMIEGVRKETVEMIDLFREQLEGDLKDEEAALVDKFVKEEEELLKQINEKIASLEIVQENLKEQLQKKLELQLEEHKVEIDNLNEECNEIVELNNQKRDELSKIKKLDCKNCVVLQKNIKKIKKQLIAMQEEERDLILTDINHNETLKTFNNGLRKTLPPLRKY